MVISELDEKTLRGIETIFHSTAGLVEVTPEELEPGTYTNAQMVEKLPNPMALTMLVLKMPRLKTPQERRKWLSKEVDNWKKSVTKPLQEPWHPIVPGDRDTY